MKDHIYKQIYQLTIPSVVSNISVPLLGLVDNIIVGHSGSPVYIGTVAIGTTIFNMIYWLFAFLRMGTTGLTAQANGIKNNLVIQEVLKKSCLLAAMLGGIMLILQIPILQIAKFVIQPEIEISEQLNIYYGICIWGAPAMFILYSLNGFFIGMQDTKSPMFVALFQNTANIFISLFLVYVLEMKIAGVALGTMIAQWIGVMLAAFLLKKHIARFTWEKATASIPWKFFFTINRDIFIRTLCLVSVTVFFTKTGSNEGTKILASNALLMQFFIIYSYVTDGLANAAEAMSGKYAGAKDAVNLKRTIIALFHCGFIITIYFTGIYVLAGKTFVNLLTNIPEVLQATDAYIPWIYFIPFAALLAMVWDGVFIGMTYTRGMLISMATATFVFFSIYYVTHSFLANHALWLAFLSYLFCRGFIQTLLAYKNISTPFWRGNYLC